MSALRLIYMSYRLIWLNIPLLLPCVPTIWLEGFTRLGTLHMLGKIIQNCLPAFALLVDGVG